MLLACAIALAGPSCSLPQGSLTAIALLSAPVSAPTAVPQGFTKRRGPSAGNIGVASNAPIFSEDRAPTLPFNPSLFGRGVSAIDIDHDSFADFVIATADGLVVYMNRGSQFVDETSVRVPAVAAGQVPGSIVTLVGDVTGDGLDDLILSVEPGFGRDLIFQSTADGRLTIAGLLPTVDAITSDAAFIDIENDRDLDVVRTVGAAGHIFATGRNSLSINDGSGNFVESADFRTSQWSTLLRITESFSFRLTRN
ncbi:MAG: VCBS repeat-containing protein [Planctomycetota bacterium]